MKIVMVFLSLLTAVSMYGQADFSGNWRLNLDKSQFNETPGTPAAARLFVEQQAGTITIQRNDLPKATLKIDSSAEIEISGTSFEGSKTRISMKWATDEQGLIETRTYTYQEGEPGVLATKRVNTWTLSTDKKTLTIQVHIETNKEGLSYDMILIYERQ
jgi:hypothetical protein